jgi:hypothetical protein
MFLIKKGNEKNPKKNEVDNETTPQLQGVEISRLDQCIILEQYLGIRLQIRH